MQSAAYTLAGATPSLTKHPPLPSLPRLLPSCLSLLRLPLISCARVMQFNYLGIDLFGPCALHCATLLISKVPCTCTHTHTHHSHTKGSGATLSVPVGDCYESFALASITLPSSHHIIAHTHTRIQAHTSTQRSTLPPHYSIVEGGGKVARRH